MLQVLGDVKVKDQQTVGAASRDVGAKASGNEAPGPENDITFDQKFRGYDRDQVEDYLEKLTKDYNALCATNATLRWENEGLRNVLAQLGHRPDLAGADQSELSSLADELEASDLEDQSEVSDLVDRLEASSLAGADGLDL